MQTNVNLTVIANYGNINTSGIAAQKKNDFMANVYPSPTNQQNIIQITSTQFDIISISLFDLTGRLISLVYRGEIAEGTNNIAIDVGALSPGMYFYEVKSPNFKEALKFIKQ